MPLGFAPGPSPSNLRSLFALLIQEFKHDFGDDGASMKFYDGHHRNVRVHIVWALGDLPVIAKLTGTLGHNARLPCRFCSVTGMCSQRRRHYYYPSRINQSNKNQTVF